MLLLFYVISLLALLASLLLLYAYTCRHYDITISFSAMG